MKIIGYTGSGYLLEASREEICNATGNREPYTGTDAKGLFGGGSIDDTGRYWRFAMGAVINISPMFTFITELRNREVRVKASADILESLTAMMREALPAAIVPPAETDDKNPSH